MQKVQGWVEDGNIRVSIAGTGYISSTKVQGSFPGATVTVYLAGTLTLATIYADDAVSPTAKANPFTASGSGSWFFYVANGSYDIKFSGGGLLIPFTVGDIPAGIGAAGVPSFAVASLPASKTQNAGNLARVTDNVRGLWMDTGTQWFGVAAQTINVREFGATGDGTTNDAVAIQAALTQAATLGNTTVILSRGTYGVGSAGWVGLTLDNATGVRMIAEPGAVIKLLAAPSQSVHGYITMLLFGPTAATRIELRDLVIDLNAIECTAITLRTASYSRVDGCYVSNSPNSDAGAGHAAYIFSGGSYNRLVNSSSNLTSSAVQFGVSVTGGHETGSVMANNTFMDFYATNAANLVGGNIANNVFDAGTVGGTGAYGTACCLEFVGVGTAALGWTINSNVFRRAALGPNLQIAALTGGLTSYGTVSGNVFELGSGDGFHAFGGVTDVLVTGNLARDNNFGGVSNGYGFQLATTAAGGCKRFTFTGNIACDSRSGASRTQTNGFNFNIGTGAVADVFTDIVMVGNIARNNLDRGINFSRDAGTSTARRIMISENVVTENGGFGICMNAGFTDTVINGNISLDNTGDDIRLTGSMPAAAVSLFGNRYNTSTISNPQWQGMNRTSASQTGFDVNGGWAWAGPTTQFGAKLAPAQLTADVNDYNPTDLATATTLRMTSDASRTITGIAGGTDQRVLIIENRGANDIVLANNSGSSAGGNRIYTGTGGSLTIIPTQTVWMIYESGDAKWRVIG